MTTATLPDISVCLDVNTVPFNRPAKAERLKSGDVVVIPGEPAEPGEEADSFPAVVRAVTAGAPGRYTVHVHYLEDAFDYYGHPMTDADTIYVISAATAA
ncbi:hypothetical protein [Nonomuraea recticatena]|uniref:Uncharacterized protein n=1 Tax=Nonomuraea recticatena TaxID=46178 RepID=A0ABN3RPQ3_9ACTN